MQEHSSFILMSEWGWGGLRSVSLCVHTLSLLKGWSLSLSSRLKECDVWGQCDVLRILQRYQPQSEDELFDILSLLDTSLVSPHPQVMAATLSLFLRLCSGLPAVSVAALERVRGPLLAACGSVSREMRFAALCHIQVSVSVSDTYFSTVVYT